MSCPDCRRFYVGDIGNDRVLRRVNDEEFGGVFRFSLTETGWGMCNNRRYAISQCATTRQVAIELMDAAYDYPACAKVHIQLKLRDDRVLTVYQGSPIGLSTDLIEESMMYVFVQHSVHIRLVDLVVDIDCVTSYNVVTEVQKSVRASDGKLSFNDLPISSGAKDLAAQIKCWFSDRVLDSRSILLRHFLAGLLVSHLFEDFRKSLTLFPRVSEDLHWLFNTSLNALKCERVVHCSSSAWLFDDPVMNMISDSHPAGHWHRLQCTVAGTQTRVNVAVKPEILPLSMLLRIRRPHLLIGDGGNGIFQEDMPASCTTVDKRQCSFNLMVIAAITRFCGKFQKARHRFWKRVHDECAPGSELYYELMQKYKITPARRWKYLVYLGWNDHARARKQRARKLRLRFLVTGSKYCTPLL